jgi:phenylalanyl-tRNA synthetase alpha chain
MDIKKIIEGLHPLERQVLPVLIKETSLNGVIELTKLPLAGVMRAFQWLQNKEMIELHEETKEVIILDKIGKEAAKNGLPEKRFIEAIKNKELSLDELCKEAKLERDEVNACIGILKRKAAINIKKDGKEMFFSITESGKNILTKESLEEAFLNKLDMGELPLTYLKDEEKFALDNFKKRKNFIIIQKAKIFDAKLTQLGKKVIKSGIENVKVVDRLTHEMLKTGEWKGKTFRRYDVKINVPEISAGKRHFVNESIRYIKQVWLDMGFQEMQGPMVHTAFWDLDSLFVPQDHPARTMQDTFYLGEKKIMQGELPKDHKKIKDVHENGGKTGSTGWKTKWDPEEAKQLLLRTHTTVLSALKLNELKEKDLPAKFFNVGKVFRNEALDWKHLFEFYQVDGIVIDPNANFKHLKGYLRQFFKKMGYPDVRIRPAHFPYTEPSVEVDVWHPKKKEWVELGGAGIFRPEVVVPLLGKDIPVLAWGLGMGRIISEYYNITDIRDLYKNDLKQLREMKMWLRGSL